MSNSCSTYGNNLHPSSEYVHGFSHVENSDEKATLLVVGLWTDISLRVLQLPNMDQVCVENLGGGKWMFLSSS
jgi:hypothetical protein